MRTTKISTFDQSHLAKAIKVADKNPRTYKMRPYNEFGENIVNVYRNIGEHLRHNIYDNRTGECISSSHSFPHGEIRFIDREIWVSDLSSGKRYELIFENKTDFYKYMREILPKIK